MLQPLLEYQPPTTRDLSRMRSRAAAGAAIGLILAVVAGLVAIGVLADSADNGREGSILPLLLFPISCIAGFVLPDDRGSFLAVVGLALAYYSAIGAAVGWYIAVSRRACTAAIGTIVTVHALAVLACFGMRP